MDPKVGNDKNEQSARLDIYRMLVEMADRVSQRRQAANNFYLSVNTATIAASSYLSSVQPSELATAIIAVAGICISVLWIRNIESYKELNEGKFHVITELEKQLPVKAFTDEWDFLHQKNRQKRYKPFHTVEIWIPWVFVAVHFIQFINAVFFKSTS